MMHHASNGSGSASVAAQHAARYPVLRRRLQCVITLTRTCESLRIRGPDGLAAIADYLETRG